MTDRDPALLANVRTALRACLEDRFEPGKELSDDEFENLALRLFDDQVSGKPGRWKNPQRVS